MDRKQDRRFRRAVVRKAEQAEQASRNPGHPVPTGANALPQDQTTGGGPQDVSSSRDKSSRKGKMTADKWNQ